MEDVNRAQAAWSQAAEANQHPKAPSHALNAHEVTGNLSSHLSPLSLAPKGFNSSLAACSRNPLGPHPPEVLRVLIQRYTSPSLVTPCKTHTFSPRASKQRLFLTDWSTEEPCT